MAAKKKALTPPGETGGTELFYRDANGKKQDASLHAELLGSDVCEWDVDLDTIADMNDEQLDRYLEQKQRA